MLVVAFLQRGGELGQGNAEIGLCLVDAGNPDRVDVHRLSRTNNLLHENLRFSKRAWLKIAAPSLSKSEQHARGVLVVGRFPRGEAGATKRHDFLLTKNTAAAQATMPTIATASSRSPNRA